LVPLLSPVVPTSRFGADETAKITYTNQIDAESVGIKGTCLTNEAKILRKILTMRPRSQRIHAEIEGKIHSYPGVLKPQNSWLWYKTVDERVDSYLKR